MGDLIYDRTKADVDRAIALDGKMASGTASEAERAEWMAGTKGSLNTLTDLNRIETATRTLAELLLGYGYRVSVATKTWTREDLPNRAEIDRIRHNIDALQKGFYLLPDWREIVYDNRLDFEQANALEFDLHAIGVWIDRMSKIFRKCGAVKAGQSFILPRKR